MVATKEKAKFAEDVVAQVATIAQVVVGIVPQHKAQIEELQK